MKQRTAAGAGHDATRKIVRERYAEIAASGGCCGGGTSSSCCGDASQTASMGYSTKDLAVLPAGSDLGLGCGNPTAILSLRSGQTVVDLGSGAGIDCFIASKKVGPKGRVIGVDMTPEMLAKARANASSGHYRNVDFRLGEIEHLPVADSTADVVISNCVVNLAPDKGVVYREAFRILRSGGRLAMSDVVATRPISRADRSDPSLWSSCSSGALQVPELKRLLRQAGFTDIRVDVRRPDRGVSSLEEQAALGVFSADIQATKPRA